MAVKPSTSAGLACLLAAPAAARIGAAGDPSASLPMAIVADSFPEHGVAGWTAPPLRTLTRDAGRLRRHADASVFTDGVAEAGMTPRLAGGGVHPALRR